LGAESGNGLLRSMSAAQQFIEKASRVTALGLQGFDGQAIQPLNKFDQPSCERLKSLKLGFRPLNVIDNRPRPFVSFGTLCRLGDVRGFSL
jgi:hypothetical protein